MRIDKRKKVEEVVNTIKSGSIIAIGGVHYHNSPMLVIRELIRQNTNRRFFFKYTDRHANWCRFSKESYLSLCWF